MTQLDFEPTNAASAAELLVDRIALALDTHDERSNAPYGPHYAHIDQRLNGPEGAAWNALSTILNLSAAEADLLATALAVAIDPRLGPRLSELHGKDTRLLPTEPLVRALFGHGPEPIYRPTSPLAMWRLVTPVSFNPGEALGFHADRALVDWMFGWLTLDADLALAVDTCPVGPVPDEWPVAHAAAKLVPALDIGADVRLIIEAPDGSMRRGFGAAIAAELGRDAIQVDPQVIPEGDWAEVFMLIQRFALFAETAIIWRSGARAWPRKVPLAPLNIVCTEPGTPPPLRDGASDVHVALPDLSIKAKADLLRELAPNLASESDALTAVPGLRPRDLIDVARTAPPDATAAADALRARARTRIGRIGHVVDPVYDWDDMVLPDPLMQSLRRISFEARTRGKLMQNAETRRIFARGAALSALFCGPPGVGKSMAAHVIAKDVGVNLLEIDLAATASKYIGETAKNLSQAFAQAKASGAALVFEEADAFFAKRTEIGTSNDRHANADTSHLLKLLEDHDGLVLMSTNKRGNIDPAFTRRIAHIVDFPLPGPAERLRLWQTMLDVLAVGIEAGTVDLAAMAERYDLSPAQIKSAALSACYANLETGLPITIETLTSAADRELTKEGRAAYSAQATPRRRAPRHGV